MPQFDSTEKDEDQPCSSTQTGQNMIHRLQNINVSEESEKAPKADQDTNKKSDSKLSLTCSKQVLGDFF